MWKEFLYSLINFLILFGALFLITRKMIARMFRSRQEKISQDLQDAVRCENKEARDKQKHNVRHIGKRQDQKHGVADNRAGQTDVKDPDGIHKTAQERECQHHGQDLHRPAEGVEQRVAVVPAGTSEIIFKEIDDQI